MFIDGGHRSETLIMKSNELPFAVIHRLQSQFKMQLKILVLLNPLTYRFSCNVTQRGDLQLSEISALDGEALD
jgi:hypothetical protein